MTSGHVSAVEHRFVEVNGVRLHIAEQGSGPLVLLLHGFPECWYSWRHQFGPLAAAGYRVVAPDQRGYARSEQPEDVDAYSLLHLTGDVIGLIHALGEESAVVVGHDWGAPVAWTTALLRPDVVRGVAGLSVPHIPRGPVPPLVALRKVLGDGFYQNYFQEPGLADGELAQDPTGTFRRILYSASGDSPATAPPRPWVIPEGASVLDTMAEPDRLPSWLTEDDIRAFVREFDEHGERAFTGGLNWYRNIDRNWELLAPFAGRVIDVPALFMAGDRDLVRSFPGVDDLLAAPEATVPRLHRSITLPGCGHWTQQERPDEVNAALLDFLAHLPAQG
ncbi:alpha/beta fold hydrolase [Streptomyces griseocarneus]|uniref:alpha/beta fold hydrolase n=1 Tax=Streptomyces griseocarneus TaxID=51201 RepID=UPI00167F0D8A|nr:alpha/beta hydrolase [Streptomyces griseocarneus]MBZ6474977.1 alpha/beta hydrolase [Streptomyces griseocarneus]GHG49225.1 epoxide hydrolase [Streptomyces griseocarneus]